MGSGDSRFGEEKCHPCYVTEEDLLDRIVPALQESLLHPDFLAEMREEACRQHEAETARSDAEALERRLASLEKDVATGNRNLALLPADRLPGVIAQLRAWEQEQEDVRREVRRLKAASPVDDAEEMVRRLEGWLPKLREAIRRGKPDEVRAMFRGLTDRIEVWVNAVPWGKKRRYELDR